MAQPITLKDVRMAWVAAMGSDITQGFLFDVNETRRSQSYPLGQSISGTEPGFTIEDVMEFGRNAGVVDSAETMGEVSIEGLYIGSDVLPQAYHFHIEIQLRRGSVRKYWQLLYGRTMPRGFGISTGPGVTISDTFRFPAMIKTDTPKLF